MFGDGFPVCSGITVFLFHGFPVYVGIMVYTDFNFFPVLRFAGLSRYYGIPFHTSTESNTAIPVSDFNTINPMLHILSLQYISKFYIYYINT